MNSTQSTDRLAALIRDGMEHHGANRLREAEAAYRQALALDPGHVKALVMLGILMGMVGQHREAAEFFASAAQRDPKNAQIQFNLGEAYRKGGQFRPAEAALRRAMALDADFMPAYDSAADLCLEEAARRQAAGRWGDVAELRGNAVGLLLIAGRRLFEAGQQRDAVKTLQRATTVDPKNAEAWAWLGWSLLKPYPSQAVPALRRAIELDPRQTWAHDRLCHALIYLRRDDEAQAAWQAMRAADPSGVAQRAALHQVETLPLYDGDNGTDILASHRTWGEAAIARRKAAAPRFKNDRDPERRLRIGYVSPDMMRHSVPFFLEPLLVAHDREKFEIVCYSAAPKSREDGVTERLKALAAL